jgi:hypothetical protein
MTIANEVLGTGMVRAFAWTAAACILGNACANTGAFFFGVHLEIATPGR